jgi:hypothetical protein
VCGSVDGGASVGESLDLFRRAANHISLLSLHKDILILKHGGYCTLICHFIDGGFNSYKRRRSATSAIMSRFYVSYVL